MYGFIPVDRYPELWSGYAEYQYLAPDSMVLPVPDSLDPVVATLFNPLGAGIRWGVTVPGTKAGDVVTVLGPGISGVVRRRRGKRGRCRVRDGDGARPA
jgi:alcohol dehydrogenase